MTVTSRSGGSTTDDIFRNQASTEDDLRSNASTIGGVVIGSDSAAIGSRVSSNGHDSNNDRASSASGWEKMRKIGYREGKVTESITPTASEKGKGRAFTGYDAQGTSHRRYRTESVTSDRTGSISYGPRDKFPRPRVSLLQFKMCS